MRSQLSYGTVSDFRFWPLSAVPILLSIDWWYVPTTRERPTQVFLLVKYVLVFFSSEREKQPKAFPQTRIGKQADSLASFKFSYLVSCLWSLPCPTIPCHTEPSPSLSQSGMIFLSWCFHNRFTHALTNIMFHLKTQLESLGDFWSQRGQWALCLYSLGRLSSLTNLFCFKLMNHL